MYRTRRLIRPSVICTDWRKLEFLVDPGVLNPTGCRVVRYDSSSVPNCSVCGIRTRNQSQMHAVVMCVSDGVCVCVTQHSPYHIVSGSVGVLRKRELNPRVEGNANTTLPHILCIVRGD